MDYLWTPWRYQYIVQSGESEECVFCSAARAADDKMWLVVHRGERNFVILNRFPYTSGHLMVVPNDHVASMEEAADETLVELIRLARKCERCLRSVYHPEGLNLGF